MTSKAQHTKGPWKIMQCLPRVPQYDGQTETVIVDENNRNILNRSSIFEEAANAQLIAAAPEMLEALKYAAELVEVARRYFPKSVRNSDTFQLENTCATIGKAIAKAEGNAKQLSDSGTVSPMILGAFWIVPAVWLLAHFAVLQVVASLGR